MICTYCSGRGEINIQGYEFGEIYSGLCPACNGAKTINISDVVSRMVRAEQKQAEAEGELVDLRTNIALYFHFLPLQEKLTKLHAEGRYAEMDALNPPLKRAPRPSPWVGTWLEYLKSAARLAPRS